MLSRIFDRTNTAANPQAEGKTSAQGSLLDLMNSAPAPAQNPRQGRGVAPAGGIRSTGSMLDDFTAIEAEQRLQIHNIQMANRAHQADMQQPARVVTDRAVLSPPPMDNSKAQSDYERQLDLLADELAGLKKKVENGRKAASPNPGPAEIPATISVDPDHGTLDAQAPLFQHGHRLEPHPFSFEKIFGVVFGSWKLITACAIIGAVFMAVYALRLPNMYQSTAELLIEPRGLKVLDNAVSPTGLNSEATVAYAESQVRIIESSSVVDPVIEDLELVEDPEFVDDHIDGPLKFFTSFFFSRPSSAEKVGLAKRYLYDNLDVSRVSQTFTIELSMSTTDPHKSARIANALASSYIADESGSRSELARSASRDLTSRLDQLRKQVRDSEEKVERYKAENGLVDANGRLIGDVQLARLNEQLVLVKVQAGDARTRAKLAAEADLGDVISGAIPSSLVTSAVDRLRLDYAQAKSRLERVSTKLGDRHPDRIAAASEQRSALGAISQELQRMVQTAQENYKRAKARRDDLVAQVNQLKAVAVNDSAAKVELRELNREVEANRRIYESFLLRSRETSEQENLSASSARVISHAVPADSKEGPNRKMLVASGGIVGAGIGLALTLFLYLLQCLLRFKDGIPTAPAGRQTTPMREGDLYSPYDQGNLPSQHKMASQSGGRDG